MFSFIKRKTPPAAAGASEEADSVQAARTRARRRLIGAAVLVGLGIIGFPLLFETQPRPIAVDIPIEIPSREGAQPLSLPASKPAATAAAPASRPAAEAPKPPVAASLAASVAAPAAVVASAPARAERAAPVADAERPTASPEKLREAQRAQALLDGKPLPPPAAAPQDPKAGRYVVQAGAYTDSSSLREARQKVEKLGLKTYTQVIETDSGARTRVRVGPFATREEAEQAAARIKGAGLAVSILSL